MRIPLLCLSLLAVTFTRAADSASDPAPLDARLTGFEYPFDVEFLRFSAQGNDLELAYMDVRPKQPNGRSVMLCHGKNFSGIYWKRTAEALREEGYRVVVPDLVGFGKSSKPVDFQYSFHAFGLHLKAMLEHLKIDRVSLVGHSMGGMVATRFALMFPETTSRLVLVNPIGLEDWKRFVPYLSVDDVAEAELNKTPASIRDYMTTSYFDGRWKAEYEPLLRLQAGWAVGPDRERLARVAALTSDMIFTQPVVHEFPDLKVPVLLIIGERDRTAIGKERVAPEIAARLGRYGQLGEAAEAAIPHARRVALPAIGHLPQVEAFDDYWQALRDFLATDSR